MTERELNEVRELQSEINDLEQKIMLVRDALKNIVPLRNGAPQGRDLNSRIEKLTVQIGVLEENLLELKKRKAVAAMKISAQICAAGLSRKETEVVYRRYVKCMRFRDICFELNYSNAHVFRLHGSALKKLIVE